MEKKYSVLHRKLENLESQIITLTSESPENDTTTYDSVPSEIDFNLLFIKNLLNAEIASNERSGLGQEDVHHLDQIVRRVQRMQSVIRKLTKPRPTSSFTVSGEPPMCSNTESGIDEEDDHEEVHKLDHESEEGFPLVGFTVYQNSEFVAEDDQDRLMDFEGFNEEDEEEQEGQESVHIEDITEIRVVNAEKCISDEQDEVERFEMIKDEEETIRVVDQKEDNGEKAEKDYNNDDDEDNDYVTNNTHCCFRFLFWGGLLAIGIISLIAGFPDFPDYHSTAEFFTPT